LALAQGAQPANGLLLIAKPDLRDPNFSETVVLVTQAEDGGTVGVILNRPTKLKLNELLAEREAERYQAPVYRGGPVMTRTILALMRSEERPKAPAFRVLKEVYLTMHPGNLQTLLATPDARYRLYAGFSGWAPGQLQSELERGGWYVLPATEELVFRRDTSGLWRELLEKASRRPVRFAGP
jgi:putative transcriptional regulator